MAGGDPQDPRGDARRGDDAGLRSAAYDWLNTHSAVLGVLLAAASLVSGTVIGLAALGAFGPPKPDPSAAIQTSTPTAQATAPTSTSTLAPTPSPTDPVTEQLLFRPFTDSGLAADFTVANITSGECNIGAFTSADPEALRCFTDGDSSLVLDPCWTNVARDEVACLENPWKKIAILLSPVQVEEPPIETPTLDPSALPFAVEIESPDGERLGCTLLSSFAGTVAGLQRYYECAATDDSGASGALYGEIDRSADLWRMRYASTGGSELRWARILRVWA